jgi:tRNA U38,U39,U40 pseudouridine synthase TruA
VRNIVGASLLVSQGGMSYELLEMLIKTGGKRGLNLARPAPPEGLTLEHVYYDNY